MTTLIDIAADVASELQVVPPSTLTGLTDTYSRRFMRYAHKVAERMVREADWVDLRKTHTFIYGSEDIIPDDFGRMIPETLWNETLGTQIHGPVSSALWQLWRIRGTSVIENRFTSFYFLPSMPIHPSPSAGDTLSYIYVSSYYCESAAGVGKPAFTDDTDIFLLNSDLLTTGVILEWLSADNLPFEMAMNSYKDRLMLLTDHDNAASGVLEADNLRQENDLD